MARLIELHSQDTDKRVLINFDEIATMCNGTNGAVIYFNGNNSAYVMVKESYDEIIERLRNNFNDKEIL